jgi:hypothetical protein
MSDIRVWGSISGLRTLSQVLTWTAFGLAVLAAAATVARYFVDRRGNELRAAAATAMAAQVEADRKAREEAMATQLAAAEARVAAAEGQAATAAAASERLRLAQQPRAEHLRAARAAAIQTLRSQPPLPVRLAALAADAEAQELALELHHIFSEAGWAVGPIDGVIAPGNPQGILVRYRAGDSSGSATLTLLRSLGLQIEEVAERDRADLEITVYFKARTH